MGSSSGNENFECPDTSKGQKVSQTQSGQKLTRNANFEKTTSFMSSNFTGQKTGSSNGSQSDAQSYNQPLSGDHQRRA
jgi:hypothetical protein